MKMHTKRLARWIGALAIAAFAPMGYALPINGNFETGDLSGWLVSLSVTGDCLVEAVGGRTDGTPIGAARFNCEDVDGVASLSVDPVLANPSGFNVDFWVRESRVGAGNSFLSNLTGVVLVAEIGNPDSELFNHYFGVLPAGSNLKFSLTTDDLAGSAILDDVTISAIPGASVPEPGTLLLVGAALTVGAVVRRRKQA